MNIATFKKGQSLRRGGGSRRRETKRLIANDETLVLTNQGTESQSHPQDWRSLSRLRPPRAGVDAGGRAGCHGPAGCAVQAATLESDLSVLQQVEDEFFLSLIIPLLENDTCAKRDVCAACSLCPGVGGLSRRSAY